MKRALPARPEQMKMRLARIGDHFKTGSPMMRIPPIAASECELVLHAYYGGRWKMVWALFKKVLWEVRHERWNRFIIWICDTAGWTKIYDVPQTATHRAYKQRHGRKCSGSPNCQDMDCIDRSLPGWFRKLTRFDK